jgi:hypothetical protein
MAHNNITIEVPLGSVNQARDALETLKAMVSVAFAVIEQDTGEAVKLAELRRLFNSLDDMVNGRPDNPENSPRGWADA